LHEMQSRNLGRNSHLPILSHLYCLAARYLSRGGVRRFVTIVRARNGGYGTGESRAGLPRFVCKSFVADYLRS
jgi:hypothetical protein